MSSEDVLCGSKRTAPETDETREEHESSVPKDDSWERSEIDRAHSELKIEIESASRASLMTDELEKRDPEQVSPGKSSKYLFLVSTYFMQGLQAVDRTQ